MIVGIDEAGRGCWAGPLIAAAVGLPVSISDLQDSKKLSPGRRQKLAQQIHSQALVGVGVVEAHMIDQLGLTRATSLAMSQALRQLDAQPVRIIIDGNYNYLPEHTGTETIVGADGLVDEVSAASIIAKTTRDAIMQQADLDYPNYGFARHVGYGTKHHRQQLLEHGPCRLHRLSYRPLQQIVKLRQAKL